MQATHVEALILINQLKDLRNEVEKIAPEDAGKPGRPGSGITELIGPYNVFLERTKAFLSKENPKFFNSISHIEPQREFGENLHATYHKKAKSRMLIGTANLMSVLESHFSPVVVVPSMKVTREGIFFGGEYFDALMAATDMIAQAQSKIVVIDGYVDEETLKLLTGKHNNVEVQILTKLSSVTQAFELAASRFNAQYKGLSVSTSDEFHDRFIIIDDANFYHFGASIKDLARRSFMFSRIEEPEIIVKLRDKFTDEWNQANVVQLPP